MTISAKSATVFLYDSCTIWFLSDICEWESIHSSVTVLIGKTVYCTSKNVLAVHASMWAFLDIDCLFELLKSCQLIMRTVSWCCPVLWDIDLMFKHYIISKRILVFAGNCDDAELRAIVESALAGEKDNLEAARRIEGDASSKFGGRFNSIVSGKNQRLGVEYDFWKLRSKPRDGNLEPVIKF